MFDDKKYTSFVVGVARDHRDKISVLTVGTKRKGQPADILAAYAGDEAQVVYDILVGRRRPQKASGELI